MLIKSQKTIKFFIIEIFLNYKILLPYLYENFITLKVIIFYF